MPGKETFEVQEPPEVSFSQNTRVMIAEDDPISRTMLKATLNSWNIEVVEAHDGRQALDILQSENPPRLALMDWVMPELDGIEVCRALRESKVEPYIYIILLTSMDRKQDLLVGLQSGADDYLSKPFDISELQARLKAGERLVELQSQLWETREALRYEATHDHLTDLLNQRALLKSLQQELESESPVALLALDLDRFRFINETMGYAGGDEILRETGRRLQRLEGTLVARKAEDEFLLLAQGQQPEAFAEQVLEQVRAPFSVADQTLHLGASIGVALAGPDGNSPQDLLKHAEAALYQAKENGRGRVEFFNDEIDRRLNARMNLERSLYSAVRSEEFSLVYQPIVHLDSGEVVGVEAFLRWGELLPRDFLAVAEETGLIRPLGRWVLKKACSQLRQWKSDGLDLFINVNLSGRQLLTDELGSYLITLLEEEGLQGRDLVVDVQEDVYQREQFRPQLEQLGSSGVRISLDDFGTGVSKLETIRLAQTKFLKLASGIVGEVPHNRQYLGLCVGVIRLATGLHMQALAEGVETDEQFDFLQKNDCHLGQGNYFCQPCSAETLTTILKEGSGDGRLRPGLRA